MNEEQTTTYNSKAGRVAVQLAEDIRLGKFDSGILLPADATLAQRYNVTRETMRKSLALFSRKQPLIKLPQGGCMIRGGKSDAGEIKTSRKLSLAVVWATVPSGHQMEICRGIETYVREHQDLHLKIFLPAQGHQEAIRLLNSAAESGWDGIIVYPYANEQYTTAIQALVEKNFPIICVDRRIDQAGANSVEVYNTSGMFRATAFLIEKYHRPVHILAGKLEQSTQIDRYDGYRQAMGDAGYDHLIASHTFESDITENDPQYWPVEKKWLPGLILAEKFLDHVTLPAGVVCTHDYNAKGLYEAARKRGLVIGKDLAVVSFDDLPMARLMSPPLTTVRQPRTQLGYESAALLHRLILGAEKSPQHIYLPVELIMRDSA